MPFRLRTCIKTVGPARLDLTLLFFSRSVRADELLLSSVKFGTLSQSPAQVLANLTTALPAVIAAVHGGWDNVQSLGIKSSKSASLPIWSCRLGNDEGSRWHGLTLESLTLGAEDGGDSEDATEQTSAETLPTTKPAKAIEQPPVQGTRHKRVAEVSEPPSQKKLKKVPSEPTTMGPLTTPKLRKGSKVRMRIGVNSCYLTNQNQDEPPYKPNRCQEVFSLAGKGYVNDGRVETETTIGRKEKREVSEGACRNGKGEKNVQNSVSTMRYCTCIALSRPCSYFEYCTVVMFEGGVAMGVLARSLWKLCAKGDSWNAAYVRS